MSREISENDWALYEILEPHTTHARHKYHQLVEIMTTCRFWTNGKPMGKHTRMFMNLTTGRIRIRYHDTDIITCFPNGGIHIQPYDSTTTRRRLNQFLPHGVRIYRSGGVQYLGFKIEKNLPEVRASLAMSDFDGGYWIGIANTWEQHVKDVASE